MWKLVLASAHGRYSIYEHVSFCSCMLVTESNGKSLSSSNYLTRTRLMICVQTI